MYNLYNAWKGKLPQYWDINEWFILKDHLLYILYKDNENKRLLEVIDLRYNQSLHKEKIICNSIIGEMNGLLYMCKIEDARTHLQISNITCYDTNNRTYIWRMKENFLVEKYKTPYINSIDVPFYSIGNKTIDLRNKNVINKTLSNKCKIKNKLALRQNRQTLECVNTLNEIIWAKDNYYINWYHFVEKNQIYLLLPNSKIEVINMDTGDTLKEYILENLRTDTGRLGGMFEIKNEFSYSTSSIFDILCDQQSIYWINNNNQLITNRETVVFSLNENTYLAKINYDYLVLVEILDEVSGKLRVIKRGI